VGGPGKYGWGAVDDGESIAAIRHALDSGVNWIDTAAAYGLGHSEEIVGKAIEPFISGDNVYVFTKCGRSWYASESGKDLSYDLRPGSIRYECEESLKRLGVERIDLYQLHWPDIRTGTAVEDSWATMGELVDEGKVHRIGVSNFSVDLLQRCESVRHIDSVQPPLSMINRWSRSDVIPWCARHDTGVIVYSPMGSGLLTGAFTRERIDALEPDDWRRNASSFQSHNVWRTLELVEQLKAIAQRLEVTLAELVVAWALATPGVTAAIVGGRAPAQVDGWISAGDLDLDAPTMEEIERAIAETGAGTDEPPSPPQL